MSTRSTQESSGLTEERPAGELPRSGLRQAVRVGYEKQREMLDHERRAKRDERGWVGLLFGGSDEKQGNIAGLALVLFILLFAAVLFFYNDPAPGLSKKDVLTVVGGFITLTLGYVFGKSG